MTEEKKAALFSKIDQLYNCDFFSDDFDPDGHEYHLELVAKVISEYSFKDFYYVSFDWLRRNCRTPDQYINFANLYFYYGGTDFFVDNPYPFLAYLYNGIDWEKDAENAEKADNISEIIAVNMLQQAEIYHGYADEYDPFKDKRLIEERARISWFEPDLLRPYAPIFLGRTVTTGKAEKVPKTPVFTPTRSKTTAHHNRKTLETTRVSRVLTFLSYSIY